MKVLVIAAVITVRKPIPNSITSVARSRPAAVVGTWSPYPTVVVVWTAHQSPDPIEGNSSWSTTVMRTPVAAVIATVATAITTAAPRGVVARASAWSRCRSSLVSSSIAVRFALVCPSPSAHAWRGSPRRPGRTSARLPRPSRGISAGVDLPVVSLASTCHHPPSLIPPSAIGAIAGRRAWEMSLRLQTPILACALRCSACMPASACRRGIGLPLFSSQQRKGVNQPCIRPRFVLVLPSL